MAELSSSIRTPPSASPAQQPAEATLVLNSAGMPIQGGPALVQQPDGSTTLVLLAPAQEAAPAAGAGQSAEEGVAATARALDSYQARACLAAAWSWGH